MLTTSLDKGIVCPEETEPDLPVSVQESLAEVWVGGSLLLGQGAMCAAVSAQDLLKEVAIIFITSTIVWSQVKQQGGNTTPSISRKLN